MGACVKRVTCHALSNERGNLHLKPEVLPIHTASHAVQPSQPLYHLFFAACTGGRKCEGVVSRWHNCRSPIFVFSAFYHLIFETPAATSQTSVQSNDEVHTVSRSSATNFRIVTPERSTSPGSYHRTKRAAADADFPQDDEIDVAQRIAHIHSWVASQSSRQIPAMQGRRR
ncbi:hypothetical protein K458DRAFT_448719 [Lentithecium fluviatile CBS 122367]|uniref:Uncharacterized protein n=1 Tax=Lentithecium fluviatile CBS 122367 TaxID=1168545 RepID=A0A6G1JN30_9PLEO|nr:hypothetical protein K458DRAFT_448719 [Lentithecium fluviatile CBS 122367]